MLPFRKQTQIPRLKSANEVYKFRLGKNGKHNLRLAEVFAAANRILQIRRRLRRPQFFRRIFGGSKTKRPPEEMHNLLLATALGRLPSLGGCGFFYE